MSLARRNRSVRATREPSIALINIVFLMLVFFLIAGTVAPPLDPDVKLASAAELEAAPPPDALVLHEDGRLSFRGEEITPDGYLASRRQAADGPVRLVPARETPARGLMATVAALREAGADRIVLVTQRAHP